MSPQERIDLARRKTHRDVWCTEPITRIPVDEQQAREAAASAAFQDGQQTLNQVLT